MKKFLKSYFRKNLKQRESKKNFLNKKQMVTEFWDKL